ncbi:hypothetical protein MNBD_GAMMA26-1428 [hydrothermal vent metagenome]|uniref:Peptidase S24/S26A/S26B/S26C domain-containing protein n=1 Tax=hydrothermal vent metagenome TaxID=652676 RepID=A0A3B1ATQ3_9ZZZZ
MMVSKELAGLADDILRRDLELRMPVYGQSMTPTINDGDMVVIKGKTPSELRFGDLLLFKNNHGKTILHRLIRFLRQNNKVVLQTRGDSTYCLDEPISPAQVLGIVSRIERSQTNGLTKIIDLEHPCYRLYNYFIARRALLVSGLYYKLRPFKASTRQTP